MYDVRYHRVSVVEKKIQQQLLIKVIHSSGKNTELAKKIRQVEEVEYNIFFESVNHYLYVYRLQLGVHLLTQLLRITPDSGFDPYHTPPPQQTCHDDGLRIELN